MRERLTGAPISQLCQMAAPPRIYQLKPDVEGQLPRPSAAAYLLAQRVRVDQQIPGHG